jgi:hypothetical protein
VIARVAPRVSAGRTGSDRRRRRTSRFYIDVTDAQTKRVDNWAMEMNSPNSLIRLGWSRNSMSVGDTVIVEGSLARDGTRTGNVRSVTLASTGKRLFGGSSQEAASADRVPGDRPGG